MLQTMSQIDLFKFIVNGTENGIGGHTQLTNDEIVTHFKAYQYGNPNGMRIKFKPPILPTNQITLSYSVYFPPDFIINKGGKLPGLCGGCKCNHDGFCIRPMWRRQFDNEIYVHGPPQSTDYYNHNFIYNPKYGDSLYRGASQFKLGEWNHIQIAIQLNKIGSNDGIIQFKVNHQFIFEYKSYIFRTCPHIQIDTILFVMFYGGSDVSWSPNQDTYAKFKDIQISTGMIQ
eukprot:NODE_147_length_15617_cov_0.576750.p12 type:complete len:230 gc:universal NODE_147_length_15617_cov_0.576750:3648-2959(-)